MRSSASYPHSFGVGASRSSVKMSVSSDRILSGVLGLPHLVSVREAFPSLTNILDFPQRGPSSVEGLSSVQWPFSRSKYLVSWISRGSHEGSSLWEGRLVTAELRFFWSWRPAAYYLSDSEFSLICQVIRNVLSLNDMTFRWGGAELLECHKCYLVLQERASPCPQLRPFWEYVGMLTACIDPNELGLLDLAFVWDNESLPYCRRNEWCF